MYLAKVFSEIFVARGKLAAKLGAAGVCGVIFESAVPSCFLLIPSLPALPARRDRRRCGYEALSREADGHIKARLKEPAAAEDPLTAAVLGLLVNPDPRLPRLSRALVLRVVEDLFTHSGGSSLTDMRMGCSLSPALYICYISVASTTLTSSLTDRLHDLLSHILRQPYVRLGPPAHCPRIFESVLFATVGALMLSGPEAALRRTRSCSRWGFFTLAASCAFLRGIYLSSVYFPTIADEVFVNSVRGRLRFLPFDSESCNNHFREGDLEGDL
ncbi:hypothetical protein C8R43DRAFT_942618 [Mycena crocata]|nr:hypothetical protein C8R43DRAFT_942618 [Mycena crocata]